MLNPRMNCEPDATRMGERPLRFGGGRGLQLQAFHVLPKKPPSAWAAPRRQAHLRHAQQVVGLIEQELVRLGPEEGYVREEEAQDRQDVQVLLADRLAWLQAALSTRAGPRKLSRSRRPYVPIIS
ncbi:hypothetical protein N9L68_02485 [bacterium]|nr:hypothetical protein [bacterium]